MKHWRWGLSYAGKVKGLLLLTTLLFVAEGFAQIALTGIQKFIIDDVLLGEDMRLLVPLLAGLGGLAVLYNVLHLYAALARNGAQFKLQRLLTRDMTAALHRLPVKDFRKERTGTYVQRMTENLNQASGLLASQMPQGVMHVTGAIVLSCIVGYASPLILLFIAAASVGYIALGRYFAPRLKQAAKEVLDSQNAFAVRTEEGVSSSREVIAFHRQDWERRGLQKLFARYYDKAMGQNALTNRQTLLSMPLRWSIQLCVLGYGGYLVMTKGMSIGLFVVVFQFSTQLLSAYENVFRFAMSLPQGSAAIDRVRALLDGPRVKEGTARLDDSLNRICLEEVHFQYEEESAPVLQGVSLDIPVGRKVAFVGASGGGKSTIAQLLVRFYDPDRGEIVVNGIPLQELPLEHWLERVGIVFQDPYLFPDTIRENVLMGRGADEEKMVELCRKMGLHDFIASLPKGYETEIGERGIRLSGGQRQRIALVRGLLAYPDILILDEATSALDLETERAVQRTIDEWRRGKTTVVIAHRLSTVADADLICVMTQGRLVERGTHEELLAGGPVYRSLVASAGDVRLSS